MEYKHEPVMMEEVIDLLQPEEGKNFIDLTIGGAGHAEALLEKMSGHGKLYGVDADEEAIKASRKKLLRFGDQIVFIQRNFSELRSIIREYQIFQPIHGILLDLGISSFELSDLSRGFSFQNDGPLDMRFSKNQSLTAAQIVNTYRKEALERIFSEYGEERYARAIAREIFHRRKEHLFQTTSDLVNAIEIAYRGKRKPRRIHVATKIFQALRIEVNNELKNLEIVLPACLDVLVPGGRIAIISFHGLEDRVIKSFFHRESRDCVCPNEFPVCICHHKKQIKIITKKALSPKQKEISRNRRARSAHLRVAEKLPLVK